MPIFNQDAKQYESVRKELRDILIQKKVTNRFGEVVYLDYVPWETFHLEKARLFALYKYGARCSPKLGWTKEELEDMANNFVANVIGNEAVYGDGASSGSHHNHGGRIAKILAILLYCNCSSSPKLMPWKHLSQPASGPDAQRSDAAPLRDKNLPFKHDDLNRFFGEEVARDFEYEQTRFVSLVLSKGNTHHLHSTDSLHKLLPYKSEKLVGAGTFGAVYETVIFRGHFSEGEDNVNFRPRAVARKDFKLENSSTSSSSWNEEWSIYCALQEGLPPNLRENIIKSHSCVVQPGDQGEAGTVSVFMELAQSDLSGLVECHCRDRKKDSANVHVSKMTAVARTLSALHNDIHDSNGGRLSCYHLDLKPENILVCASSKDSPLDLDSKQPVLADSYDLKVADFSVSKLARLPSRPANGRTFDNRLHYSSRNIDDQYGSRAKASTACRVGDWSTCMPPEALPQTTPLPTTGISLNKHVDAKADVWAFGCVLCIFVAWIHRGPDGVSHFCQKRREEFQNRGADRFVGIAPDGTYRLNGEVVRWFNNLVDDYRQRKDPEYKLYHALWHLLSKHVLVINPAQRYTMQQLAQALVKITQESANNAADQSYGGTMSSDLSTTSAGARSSSFTTAAGSSTSTSDRLNDPEPEVPVPPLVQRHDQSRISERSAGRVSNATTRFWHVRSRLKDASRLRPTTSEASLSSHSRDFIQPAVGGHPSNFTLDLSGDLRSCAVSPDQRHLVFLYRSSIKVCNVMSLCRLSRPGISIKAPPSYVVESTEPIRTFSLGANHLWAVIDEDQCKLSVCAWDELARNGQESRLLSASLAQQPSIEILASHPTEEFTLACVVRTKMETIRRTEVRILKFDGLQSFRESPKAPKHGTIVAGVVPGAETTSEAHARSTTTPLYHWHNLPLSHNILKSESKLFFSKDGAFLVLVESDQSSDATKDAVITWWNLTSNMSQGEHKIQSSSMSFESKHKVDQTEPLAFYATPVHDHLVLIVKYKTQISLLDLQTGMLTPPQATDNTLKLGPVCESLPGHDVLITTGRNDQTRVGVVEKTTGKITLLALSKSGGEGTLSFKRLCLGSSCALTVSVKRLDDDHHARSLILLVGCDGRGQILQGTDG